jgi:hypothetical protein
VDDVLIPPASPLARCNFEERDYCRSHMLSDISVLDVIEYDIVLVLLRTKRSKHNYILIPFL